MSEPIAPPAVMAAHQHVSMDGRSTCAVCATGALIPWPCLPYRLAEALAGERAKAARVSYVVEDYAQFTTTGRDWHLIRRLRDALADGLPK